MGRFLDTLPNENITYTMQVQDLADVSAVNSSVTSSFRLPLTRNNIEALKGLSLRSDTSRFPYEKQPCKVYDYSAIIINDGWLKINNTDDYYNVNVENGIVDLFKAVEGKTIGKDLDMTEILHSKDVTTVVGSFERNDYCYLVADYNGMNTYEESGQLMVNTDYLVPSLNNKYIWSKIFSTFGFTYEGSVFDTDDFENLWITYPKAPPIKTDDEEYPQPILRANSKKNSNVDDLDIYPDSSIKKLVLPTDTFLNGMTLQGNSLVAITEGTYNFKGLIDGVVTYKILNNWGAPTGKEEEVSIKIIVYKNGSALSSMNDYNFTMKEGDYIEFCFESDPITNDGYLEYEGYMVNSFDIKIYQISQSTIDFNKEFLDLSITDYLKEIFIRFALTPFIDVEKKHIKFKTLNERLNNLEVIDWTDRFIKRNNENYIYKDYAQVNKYKHKYNDPNGDYNDGSIVINNKNLEGEKDLYTSKMYSYNSEVTSFYNSLIVGNVFPIWSKEIKETINNDTNERTIEVNYKGLSNRFYFIRREFSTRRRIIYGSQLLRTSLGAAKSAFANTKKLAYSELIPIEYGEFSKIMNDTRIHEIDLLLDINDLIGLSFDKVYFFGQENQYYLMNRVVVDFKSKVSKAEFVRIKYRG